MAGGVFLYGDDERVGHRHADSGGHSLADVSQKAAAPIGGAFTLICLVTGDALGRKPMWGTYSGCGTRGLTSVLVLLPGSIAASSRCGARSRDPSRAARAVAILTLVGALNLPIIKFSVDW